MPANASYRVVSDATEPLHVLLIEDEPAAREACALYLARVGFTVATASCASSAAEQVRQHVPDVLVSDWRLGNGPDGISISRTLQQQHGMPIIFISAHPMDELKEASRDLDVVRYLAKPLSLAELAKALTGISRES